MRSRNRHAKSFFLTPDRDQGSFSMGTLKKTLKEQSGLKAGYGWAYLKTYRESFHMTFSEDDVIVQLAKRLFPEDNMPDEITVTVEWQDPS